MVLFGYAINVTIENIPIVVFDRDGTWRPCPPESVGEFSAVGYFFGRQLHQTLGVPIGLIDNA